MYGFVNYIEKMELPQHFFISGPRDFFAHPYHHREQSLVGIFLKNVLLPRKINESVLVPKIDESISSPVRILTWEMIPSHLVCVITT